MKKILLLLLVSLQVNTAIAQNKKPLRESMDTSKVPAFIQEKFIKEYPAITASWSVDGKNYKAFYTDPKTNMAQLIVYDHEGKVLRRENELDKKNNYAAPKDQPATKPKSLNN